MGQIHEFDIGTKFIYTVKVKGQVLDISGARVKRLIFLKPDGTFLEKDATFVTDGTDGKMRYISVKNDLTPAGSWLVHGYVEFSDDEQFHTDPIVSFPVIDNLND